MIAVEQQQVAAPAAHAAQVAPAEDGQKVLLVRNLIAVMMVGRWQGHAEDDVASILAALGFALGDTRVLQANLALASALRGDAAPAREQLRHEADDSPQSDQARLLLALALKVGGESGWEDIPARVLAVSNDDALRAFAERVRAA